MGLEVLEEFRPITPIRTSTLRHPRFLAKLSDHHEIKEAGSSDDQEAEDEESCRTPKSPSHILQSPTECPPAPKKPRQKRRRLCTPPQGYFKVPEDLRSVFLLDSEPAAKKIRAS